MTLRALVLTFALSVSVALSGCSTTTDGEVESAGSSDIFTSDYGVRRDAAYRIPAIPISRIDKRYHRQIVSYRTREKPGTIIVDTGRKFLYFILPKGKAVRYGIGVGKQGFSWKGDAYIAWKQAWPKWTPPEEMIERRPDLAKYGEKGMDPGLKNPLGARALYLFNDEGEDTLYRLHGTPEWNSIGKAVSSGCVRLMNHDIIDLYERVRPGKRARVIVR